MSELSIKIDFTILPTKEPKEIVLLDTSQWGIAYNQPAYLSILPPGYVNYINHSFSKQTYTILNSSNLGIGCITGECNGGELEDLDDGIWEFCLKSAYEGINKKRFFLKDDQLRTEIDKIRIRLLDTQGFTFIRTQTTDQLEIIEDILAGAHSMLREGRNNDTMKGYNEASKLVDKLKQCRDCI